MCVRACTKRKRGREEEGDRERPGMWVERKISPNLFLHTHTHTNLDIYLRYTCLEITLLKILSKALRS